MKVGRRKSGSVQRYKNTAVLSLHTAFGSTQAWQNPRQSGRPAARLELPYALVFHTGTFVVEVKMKIDSDRAYGIRTCVVKLSYPR